MKQFNNLIIKIILLLILLCFGMQKNISPAFAATPLTVTFGGANNSPLFNLSNMKPGDSVSKTITVVNNDKSNKLIGIRGVVMDQTGNISDIMHIQISNGANILYAANGT